jgi:hypothetical protein
MAPQEDLDVTPEELRRAGSGIVHAGQSLEVDAQPLAGVEAADAGSNSGFGTGSAGGRCEAGWQQALGFACSKLAASGDKLAVSASAYAETVFSEQIRGAVQAASEADEEAAGKLRALTPEATGFAPPPAAGSTSVAGADIPDGRVPPTKVAKWWEGLSPAQKESAIFMYPEELGELDGIPTATRDRCNRELLARAKAKLTEREHFASGEQLAQIKETLTGVEAIEARLSTEPTAAHPQAYLLGFDTRGTGHAIVAMGNPDTAANVATYVPGTTAHLGSIPNGLTRADRMVKAAHHAGAKSPCVVTWLGYNPPQNLAQAAHMSYAEHGRGKLDSFEDGLRVTHEGRPSHNTVIGHSYGTTVIGQAAYGNDTLNADDVVFVASPGLGYGANEASDLNLTGIPSDQVGQHVHSTVALFDVIHLTNGPDPLLGPTPADPAFGGQLFHSDPGHPGMWGGFSKEVHSAYWKPGSDSLRAMGQIIAGKPVH